MRIDHYLCEIEKRQQPREWLAVQQARAAAMMKSPRSYTIDPGASPQHPYVDGAKVLKALRGGVLHKNLLPRANGQYTLDDADPIKPSSP
jgi:hypothetical protein